MDGDKLSEISAKNSLLIKNLERQITRVTMDIDQHLKDKKKGYMRKYMRF